MMINELIEKPGLPKPLATCSLKPLISPYDLKRPADWNRVFGRQAPLIVEIGFGMGEMLMQWSRENPNSNYLGIEQHWERIYKTLKAMERARSGQMDRFDNVRILRIDARACFERLLAPRSVDDIYCLYPCPWPKKGHVKHRLFSHGFLKLVNNRLKNGAGLTIVTDFDPYREWIIEQVSGTGFKVTTATINPRYNTKFERKWRLEGQVGFFEIKLKKERHVRISVKKDIPLKNYMLNSFEPGRLVLENVTGEISVIFKETLYDSKQNRAMIRAVIAEEHLTQSFWIAITKKNDKWNITKAQGQNFFPTPGLAKALELVYKAARATQVR